MQAYKILREKAASFSSLLAPPALDKKASVMFTLLYSSCLDHNITLLICNTLAVYTVLLAQYEVYPARYDNNT